MAENTRVEIGFVGGGAASAKQQGLRRNPLRFAFAGGLGAQLAARQVGTGKQQLQHGDRQHRQRTAITSKVLERHAPLLLQGRVWRSDCNRLSVTPARQSHG